MSGELLNYLQHIGITVCIYVLLCLSATVSVGLTGSFNLAFPGLALLGAYCSALISIHFAFPFEFCAILAAATGGLTGLLLSAVSNRLKGDYYALVTFGFNYVVLTIALNWETMTNGALGITNIPFESFLFQDTNQSKTFVLLGLISALSVIIVYKVKSSPLGRVLASIRDDELSCIATGRDTYYFKNVSAFYSGVLAGLSGSLYAHVISYVDPFSFGLHDLVFVLGAVFLGGVKSVGGSVLGAFILTIIPELLRFLYLPASVLGPLRQMIYSVTLILIIWFRPTGMFAKGGD